jgi:hypothetical protein
MTQRTDRAARFRVSVSAEATQRELRMCGFALLNQYLTMHRVIAEHLDLHPVELLILIATTTGNVQRAVRPDALPDVLRGSTPLPPELDRADVATRDFAHDRHPEGNRATACGQHGQARHPPGRKEHDPARPFLPSGSDPKWAT